MTRALRIALLPLFAAGLFACSAEPDDTLIPATHEALAAVELPPVLSRDALFGERAIPYGWRLSAEGDRLAWVEPGQGEASVLKVEDLVTGAQKKVALAIQPDDLGWAPGGTQMLLVADTDGNQTYQSLILDLEQPDAPLVNLAAAPDVSLRLEQFVGDDVLVSHNRRTSQLMDVYRRNLKTGEEALLAENPGTVRDWHAVRDEGLFARTRSLAGGARAVDVLDGQVWAPRAEIAVEETFDFVGRQIDEGSVLALSNRGRDKVALVRFDLSTGDEHVVHADPDADIEGVWHVGADARPLLAKTYLGRTSSHFFDPALAEEFRGLTEGDPRATVGIEDMDVDARMMVVKVTSDQGRYDVWLIDRKGGGHRLLYKDPRGQQGGRFAATEPFSYQASDGLEIHGYITRPPGSEGKRLPAIVWVHGGPFTRTYWGFDPMAQFLANRGYVVIDVNYRGSSGYGKAFMAAAEGEFARKMHQDLVDAVDWADDAGLIDPNRVAIGGASYGGWAALVGLAQSSDRFVAGISINGASDLPSLVDWLAPEPNIWTAFAGDPNDPYEHADMASRSPLRQADRIVDPVLLVHAVRDNRVPIDHSIRMAAQLQALDRPVETLWVPCEGHMLTSPERFMDVAMRIEHFLGAHLGGRVSRH
ncbi:MAG: alpha/beta hydrolase family protein [Alphaproteobacteria bacterium]